MDKKLRKQMDELNGIIHTRNLYGSNGRRYINAHMASGKLLVEDLHSGEEVPILGHRFFDGYGEQVVV